MNECQNWMNYEAIRETVADYEKKWGAPDGSTGGDDLSDFNITRNCAECNMRPHFSEKTETLFQIMDLFKDPILTKLEQVGMKRKCYKAMEEK